MLKRIVTLDGEKYEYLKKCEADLLSAKDDIAEYEDLILSVAAVLGGEEE
jgi:hypothetical protein